MSTLRRSALRALCISAMAVLLFAQSSLHSKAPESREADRSAILAILSAQQAAWNKGDVDTFVKGYWESPELTFSGSSGVYRGYDGVLARYRKNYPDRVSMGHLEFSDVEFHFLGHDAALVLGKWHLTREKGDVGGVYTLVWERFSQGWRIIHDHTSAVTPANP